MRLIDADALKNLLKNKVDLAVSFKPHSHVIHIQDLENLITNAPTVQREGWIEDLKSRMHRCCEHAADYEATENYKEAIARVDLAFFQLAALTDKE